MKIKIFSLALLFVVGLLSFTPTSDALQTPQSSGKTCYDELELGHDDNFIWCLDCRLKSGNSANHASTCGSGGGPTTIHK